MANYGGPDANAFQMLMNAQQAKTDAISGTIDNIGKTVSDTIQKYPAAKELGEKKAFIKKLDGVKLPEATIKAAGLEGVDVDYADLISNPEFGEAILSLVKTNKESEEAVAAREAKLAALAIKNRAGTDVKVFGGWDSARRAIVAYTLKLMRDGAKPGTYPANQRTTPAPAPLAEEHVPGAQPTGVSVDNPAQLTPVYSRGFIEKLLAGASVNQNPVLEDPAAVPPATPLVAGDSVGTEDIGPELDRRFLESTLSGPPKGKPAGPEDIGQELDRRFRESMIDAPSAASVNQDQAFLEGIIEASRTASPAKNLLPPQKNYNFPSSRIGKQTIIRNP